MSMVKVTNYMYSHYYNKVIFVYLFECFKALLCKIWCYFTSWVPLQFRSAVQYVKLLPLP